MREYREYIKRRIWLHRIGLLETWFIIKKVLTKEELNKEKKDK